MTIRSKIANWLFDGKNVTQTSGQGWYTVSGGSWFGGDAVWQKEADKLGRVYSKSGLIHACIREKASSLSEADLQIGEEIEGGFEPIDHEALNLFYKNPDYTYSQIIEMTSARLDLYGAAYALLSSFENRFGAGDFTPIPSHLVGKKTKGATLIRYEIKTDKDPIPVEPNEMCAVELLDPATFHCLTSPTQTILKDLGIDMERQQITMEILKNKALPGLFLRPETNLPEAQRKMLRDSLNQYAGGDGRNRGSVTVLPSKIDVQQGADVTDIDFDVLNGLTESRICMAYAVPPILIAAKIGLDKSTYSNYEQARQSFYKETINPLWAQIETALTRSILSPMPETQNLVFKFDRSKIAELQEDMNEASERASLLFEKKVVTRNEAREMVGLVPLEGEEGGFLQMPAPVMPSFTKADDEQGKTQNLCTCEQMQGKIGQTEKAPAAVGTFPEAVALEETLRREFKKQEEAAIRQLEELGYVQMSTIGVNLGAAIESTLLAIAQTKAIGQIREVGEMAKSHRHKLGGKEAQLVGAFDVVNPELEKQMKLAGEQISEVVNATTQKKVDDTLGALRQELVNQGVKGPNTVKALTEGVKRVFQNASDFRARTIAITESSRALNDSKILSADATGIVQGFTPLVSPDACELCQVYDGNNPTGQALFPYTSKEDAKAQIGQYDDRSLPPYHPNCRCVVQPVLITEPTPEAASATALPQGGQRKAETPRRRPGGRPDKAEPRAQFVRNAVKELSE